MIEEVLTAKLKTVTEQVFPNKAPESAVEPLIIYQRTSTDRPHYLSGPASVSAMTFRVDVYQKGYSETLVLTDAVRVACDGWQDDNVQYCHVTDEMDFGFDPDEDGFYRRTLFLRITTK